MSNDTIDYFYSLRSSFTYLGAAQLNALARGHGLEIRHYPMDLGEVIQAYDDLHDPRPSERSYAGARAYEKFDARERYTRIEYKRWSEHLGVEINLDPVHHYGPRELPSGVVIAAQSQGFNVDELSRGILEALWKYDRDIADPAVLCDVIDRTGLQTDPAALCEQAMGSDIQARFSQNTQQAVALGVFGSPFYIFRNQPYFGQDRLFFIEAEIKKSV